jgi:hypothetical protein
LNLKNQTYKANIHGAKSNHPQFRNIALQRGAVEEPDVGKWLAMLTNDAPLIYFEIFDDL